MEIVARPLMMSKAFVRVCMGRTNSKRQSYEIYNLAGAFCDLYGQEQLSPKTLIDRKKSNPKHSSLFPIYYVNTFYYD